MPDHDNCNRSDLYDYGLVQLSRELATISASYYGSLLSFVFVVMGLVC